jgi:hypothetical protein
VASNEYMPYTCIRDIQKENKIWYNKRWLSMAKQVETGAAWQNPKLIKRTKRSTAFLGSISILRGNVHEP